MTRRRIGAVFGVLGALVISGVFFSLRLGSQSYSLAQLWAALVQPQANDPVARILLYVRLPRTVASLLAGAALGVSGALIQAVLNNAMASPNIIGVNAGAGFFAMTAAAFLPTAASKVMPAAAFLGALATALFIYALAARAGLSRTNLILAGVTVSSILTAGLNALKLLLPTGAVMESAFMMGGFKDVTLAAVCRAAPYLAVGLLLALFLAVDLDVLRLGEETAAGLGLNVKRVRFAAILAAALLAGAAVSFAGLLGFVGLLAPHMARRFVGGEHRVLLPATLLFSGALVLWCDILARVLFAPFELPVGILLSLLGGPFLLWLLLRRKRGRLYE